jgi:predicted esterase
MPTSLLVLHGYTMNGETMRRHMAALAAQFPSALRVVYASAPHPCSAEAVERFYGASSLNRPAPPYLAWWDATDDGTEYRGWEATRDELRALVADEGPVGVLGFSQGAILGAFLAAAAQHGQFPPLQFAVLIAGRTPRATAFQPLFDRTLSLPSLHVWGERDGMAEGSRELTGHFDASTSEVVTWDGTHRVPAAGPGASAIVRFVERHIAAE